MPDKRWHHTCDTTSFKECVTVTMQLNQALIEASNAVQASNYERANHIYTQILHQIPNCEHALLGQAHLAGITGLTEVQGEILSHLTVVNPSSINARKALAKHYLSTGNSQGSVEQLLIAVSHGGQDIECFSLLSNSLKKLNAYDQAVCAELCTLFCLTDTPLPITATDIAQTPVSIFETLKPYFTQMIDDLSMDSKDANLHLNVASVLYAAFFIHRSRDFSTILPEIEAYFSKLCDLAYDYQTVSLLYDLIRFVYWSTYDDHDRMSAFNKTVKRFCDYHNHLQLDDNCINPAPAEADKFSVAYFTNTASCKGTYALGSLLLAMLKGHIKENNPNIDIYLYSYNRLDDDFKQTLVGSKIVLRDFSMQANSLDKLVAVKDQMHKDNISICVADTNLSSYTTLFQLRTAPIQCYWSIGFRHWKHPKVDYLLLPKWSEDTADKYFDSSYAHQYIYNPRDLDLHTPKNVDAITDTNLVTLKSSDKLVFGTYCRLVKINSDYLDLSRKVLDSHDNAHLLIVGTGDVHLIKDYIEEHDLQQRVTIINHFINGYEIANTLDIFLDTFPNIAGKSAFECMSVNTPVLHTVSDEWGKDIATEYRDKLLITDSTDETLAKFAQLLNDKAFYQSACQRGHEVLKQCSDTSKAAASMEAAWCNMIKSL